MPKFAVLVHASKESEAAQMPKPGELDEMHAFNRPYFESGVILHADGFLASSKGARVTFSEGSEPSITNGPFELENLVAGYWILKLDNIDEAIKFAKGIPFKNGGVDIRQIAGPEDFGDELTEEQKKQWEVESKK